MTESYMSSNFSITRKGQTFLQTKFWETNFCMRSIFQVRGGKRSSSHPVLSKKILGYFLKIIRDIPQSRVDYILDHNFSEMREQDMSMNGSQIHFVVESLIQKTSWESVSLTFGQTIATIVNLF